MKRRRITKSEDVVPTAPKVDLADIGGFRVELVHRDNTQFVCPNCEGGHETVATHPYLISYRGKVYCDRCFLCENVAPLRELLLRKFGSKIEGVIGTMKESVAKAKKVVEEERKQHQEAPQTKAPQPEETIGEALRRAPIGSFHYPHTAEIEYLIGFRASLGAYQDVESLKKVVSDFIDTLLIKRVQEHEYEMGKEVFGRLKPYSPTVLERGAALYYRFVKPFVVGFGGYEALRMLLGSLDDLQKKDQEGVVEAVSKFLNQYLDFIRDSAPQKKDPSSGL